VACKKGDERSTFCSDNRFRNGDTTSHA
jgi:hypothetical protein